MADEDIPGLVTAGAAAEDDRIMSEKDFMRLEI